MSAEFRLMTEEETLSWYENELCEAFAEYERKPLGIILELIAAGRYEPWGLFENGGLTGYAAVTTAPGVPLALLDYLGVTAARRSAGIGSAILARLIAAGRPLVVESELPVDGGDAAENDIRRRRIAFYIRNGFTPVYLMATCGMIWQALTANADGMPPEETARQHKAIYDGVRSDVIAPLPAGAAPPPSHWGGKK